MFVDLVAQDIEVPPLASRQIAAEANSVLREYARLFGAITKPPIEIEDIASTLLELDVQFDDLQRRFDDRVHGAIWFSTKQILIDDELNPDHIPELLGRYHFTLAHELGHWQLHRFLFLDEDERAILFDDDPVPDVICRSTGGRPLIEKQADEFAGCLLMPEWLLRPEWRVMTGGDNPICDEELRQRVPRVDPFRRSFVDGMEVEEADPIRLMREAFCEPLAERFAVSQEAMRIELEKLGLFVEERQPGMVG